METLDQIQTAVESCRECPRLVAYREMVASTKTPRFSSWVYWGRPVAGFGDPLARILILGLAPAANGANRTGRVFTGDQSSKFLMQALHQIGLSNQASSDHRDDGLSLKDVYITSAVKCVPPSDRPTKLERNNCCKYLIHELTVLPNIQIVLTLGKFAFDSFIRIPNIWPKESTLPFFEHGKHYSLGTNRPALFASYHPSPRNTNTGKINLEAFIFVLNQIQQLLK